MQAHPEPQHRIGEAVALLARDDQVDVFQPRQIVLRRSRRAAEAQGDLGERQRFLFCEHLEDGFQRAVAARAVQAELVRELAGVGELTAGREQRRQRADRIGGAARAPSRWPCRRSVARTPAGRPTAPARAARARRARDLPRPRDAAACAVGAARQRRADLGGASAARRG